MQIGRLFQKRVHAVRIKLKPGELRRTTGPAASRIQAARSPIEDVRPGPGSEPSLGMSRRVGSPVSDKRPRRDELQPGKVLEDLLELILGQVGRTDHLDRQIGNDTPGILPRGGQ